MYGIKQPSHKGVPPNDSMPHLETTSATEAYRQRCEDRLAVFATGERAVIVVADGAGGVGAGELAAEAVVREVEAHYAEINTADGWTELLRQIDCRVGPGESTAVVVDIRPYGMAVASVGDSQAWIIADGAIDDLTRDQQRKPLLGSGQAAPVARMHPPLAGLLLVATDGFFNYAKAEEVTRLVTNTDFYSTPRKCIELVRLPSGELWDDIAVVVARVKPATNTRQRYAI